MFLPYMIFSKWEILLSKGGEGLNRFICRTKLLSGAGAVEALGNMEIRRLLLVADPYFVENGTASRIASLAKAEKTEIFSDVTPDPPVELVAAGTARVKALEPDTIVALGGGSAMDCAKAMAYFGARQARLVMIPTTSGSGSEVTDFAVLTHNGIKHPLVDSRLQPEVAILDSDLLAQLPPALVADSGFDVLSHALEAYVATGAGPVTDALAADAFSAAFAHLPASFAGNRSVRLKIHAASAMAGMAFSSAGLGLCHAMSHALGGAFHLPHGRLNAILLPAVVSVNAHSAMEKYAKIARAAGLGGSADALAVRNLKNALVRLRRELHLPATLQQAGIQPAQVYAKTDQIVDAALADPCCKTNPTGVEDYMVRSVLEEVTGRG